MAERVRLPQWLWLWFPPLLAIIIFATKLSAPVFYERYIEGEHALVELATPVVALCGFVVGLSMLRTLHQVPSRAMRLWVILITLSCLYLAGEELSWGQQLFQWDTPEAVEELNDQHETNLHNMSSWFDQKPRLLLELWVIVGGIVLPLRRLLGRQAGFAPVSFAYWFWPTIECLPSAVLAVLIRLPDRYKDVFGVPSLSFDIRWSEPQEYYMVLFLFIYILSLRQRLIGLRAATAALVRAEH